MAQQDTDTYAGYSNGNLATVSSAKWTKGGSNDLVVASNKVIGASSDSYDYVTSWPYGDDQWSQVVISTPASVGSALWGGPVVRSAAGTTYYWCNVYGGSGTWELYRTLAGSYSSVLASGSHTNAGGDICCFGIQGYVITAWLGGFGLTQIFTFTDTDASKIASGKPGQYWGGINNGIYGTWTAGDYTSVGGQPTLVRGRQVPGMYQGGSLVPRGGGRFFGRTKSGLYVPRHLKEAA